MGLVIPPRRLTPKQWASGAACFWLLGWVLGRVLHRGGRRFGGVVLGCVVGWVRALESQITAHGVSWCAEKSEKSMNRACAGDRGWFVDGKRGSSDAIVASAK